MENQWGQAAPALRWYNPNRFNAANAAVAYLFSALALCALQFAVLLFLPTFGEVPYLLDIVFTLLSQGAMLGIALLFSREKKVELYRGGGDYYDTKQSRFGWVLLIFLGCILAFGPLSDGFLSLLFTEEELLGALGEQEEGVLLFPFFAMVVIFPAICEEALFRGVICRGLTEYGKLPAVLISALFFALMHASPLQTVYQFFLGVFLGVLMVETGNIYLCMLLHGMNNALSGVSSIQEAMAGISPAAEVVYVIITAVIGVVLLGLAVRSVCEKSRRIPMLLREDGSPFSSGIPDRDALLEQKKRQAGNYFYAVKEVGEDGAYVDRTQPYFVREPLAGERQKWFYTDDHGWQKFNRRSKRWQVVLFSVLGSLVNLAFWIFMYVSIKGMI